MSEGSMDKAKGRVKKTAGEATDNDELKREGQKDETSGKVKDALDSAKDKASDVVDKLRGD
jgi:uncharacterized protein YjbJ (UPF0337 family)